MKFITQIYWQFLPTSDMSEIYVNTALEIAINSSVTVSLWLKSDLNSHQINSNSKNKIVI